MLGDEFFPLRSAYTETHNAPSVRRVTTKKGLRRNVYVPPKTPSYIRDLSKRKLFQAGLVKNVLNRPASGKSTRRDTIVPSKNTFRI